MSFQLSDIPNQLTEEAFWELFGRVEHETLEFKRIVRSPLDTIPAMAMTDGGLIVFGIDETAEGSGGKSSRTKSSSTKRNKTKTSTTKGGTVQDTHNARSIVGCPMTQSNLDRISQYATECHIEIQTRSFCVDETEMMAVAVPAVQNRIVTTPNGRLLRRIGGTNQPLVGDAMYRFFQERSITAGEDLPVADIAPADIDINLLNEALAAARRPLIQPDSKEQLLRALADLDLTDPSSPPDAPQALSAAVILFAQKPRKFNPHAEVRLVRTVGTYEPKPGTMAALEDYEGPLSQVFAQSVEAVKSHIKSWEVIDGIRRAWRYEYPEAVFREAIVNALAHRDYNLTGATIDIKIWDDRMEIHSPGPLPGHITVENMAEHRYRRNPKIVRVLKTLGELEDRGHGVKMMHEEMALAGLPAPEFIATPTSLTVILRNLSRFTAEERDWLSAFDPSVLTPEELRALVMARREGAMPPRRLRELFPETDISQMTDSMTAKGLLERVGKRGGTCYQLSEELIRSVGSKRKESKRLPATLSGEIKKRGSITTQEAAEFLNKPLHAVRRLLNDLAEDGIIRAEGQTKARRYYPAG